MHQIIPHLEKAGITCAVEPVAKGMVARWRQWAKAAEADIVFLQKRLIAGFWTRRLRKLARRLVYDFDDAVFLDRKRPDIPPSSLRTKRMALILQSADAVIAANDYLADFARQHAAPAKVKVIPIFTEVSRWPRKQLEAWGARIVLGWMGSPSNHQYLRQIREPLARVCQTHSNVRVKIISDSPVPLEGVALDYGPFRAETEVADVSSFDIGLACVPDDPWTRGKSPAKIINYMAAGLPIVASDVTCVQRTLTHEVNGLLARDLSDWERQIGRLIGDATMAGRLGRAARDTAEQRYDGAKIISEYVALFKELSK